MAVAVAARVAGAVQRAKDLVGQAADVLHDVNLTGLRPADLVNIGTEHPERGPQPGPARRLDARLDPAIGDLEPVLGQQPRRGVLAGAVVALQRWVSILGGNHQVAAAVGRGVGAAGSVILQLVVAPTGDAISGAVADLIAPDVGVRRRAWRAIELIAPDELPVCGVRGSRQVVGEVDMDRLVAVATVVPEAQPRRGAPVLADGEGAAKVIGDLRVIGRGLWSSGTGHATTLHNPWQIKARPRADLEHMLVGALARQRQRASGCDLRVGQSSLRGG